MAVDYFLKIKEAPGESLDSKHKDEIEVQSWSWGESNGGSSAGNSGAGAGKVNMQDFQFTMPTNKASPKLFLACAQGQHLGTAVLTCRKAGTEQQEFLIFTFTDVLISSYSIGGASEIPQETISFNFTKVEMSYAAQNKDGKLASPVKHNYDLKASKGA